MYVRGSLGTKGVDGRKEVLELLKKRNERKRQSGRNYGGQVNFSRVRSDKDEAASTLSPGKIRDQPCRWWNVRARGRCSYFRTL